MMEIMDCSKRWEEILKHGLESRYRDITERERTDKKYGLDPIRGESND